MAKVKTVVNNSAIALVRIAQEQSPTGKGKLSILAQRKKIQEAAASRNLEVVKTWVVSGSSADSLLEIVGYCNRNLNISSLIVASIDRVSRSYDTYSVWKEKLEEIGIELVVADETKFGEFNDGFMEAIAGVLANKHSKLQSEQIKRALRNRVEQGYYVNKPPVGYDLTGIKGFYYPNECGEDISMILQSVADQKLSLEEGRALMRTILKAHGVNDRRKSRIERIFRNPYYAGLVTLGEEIFAGIHLPLISEKQHQSLVELFASSQ